MSTISLPTAGLKLNVTEITGAALTVTRDLIVCIGGLRIAVTTLAEASSTYRAYLNAGRAPIPVTIAGHCHVFEISKTKTNGMHVATVTYNCRVWAPPITKAAP